MVDWLHRNVEGFVDRREARKYAGNLLKAGYIRHTVNKVTFSEQCYYVFGDVCGGEERLRGGGACVQINQASAVTQTWPPCLCWTQTKLLLHQQVEPTVSHRFCLRVLGGPQSSPTRSLCPTPAAHLHPSISSRLRREEEEVEEEGASTVKVTLISITDHLTTPPPQSPRLMLCHWSQQAVSAGAEA